MQAPDKIVENAHKFTYLVRQFPNKPFKPVQKSNGEIETGLIEMFQMTAIEINTAHWYAKERGWVGNPDPETDIVPLLDVPTEWQFGKGQNELQQMIIWGFAKMAEKENDLEEYGLTAWLQGYPAHEVFIATNYLMETKRLAEYELTDPTDPESVYKFYTLYEHGEQLWGQKQFKINPVTGEPNEEAKDEQNE